MKNYFMKLALLMAIAVSFSAMAQAQLRVTVRPSISVHTRPSRPSSGHIWVSGEWAPRGGRYEYREGYWARPPQHRTRYTEGHWVHTRRGYYWVSGYWR